jgi:exodeoxyribonuclease-3
VPDPQLPDPELPDLRVASVNVNGIRAAVRRGLLDWIARRRPDVLCLQEVRAPLALVPPELWDALPGYTLSYAEGDRAGRNGVAVLSREAPSAIRVGLREPGRRSSVEFGTQGRYLEVDLPAVTVASLYLPKGAADGPALATKLRFLRELSATAGQSVRRARRSGREYLVCGDFNIAPAEVDLKSWKTNRRSPGFLPVEREWITGLARDPGIVDVLRALHPDRQGPYTWWSWRGRAFDEDAGWRIDHHFATPRLAAAAVAGGVDREVDYASRVADHAPVWVDYRLPV